MSVVVPGKLVLSTMTSLNPEKFFDKSLATDRRNERSGSPFSLRGVGTHTITISEPLAPSDRLSVALIDPVLTSSGRCFSL